MNNTNNNNSSRSRASDIANEEGNTDPPADPQDSASSRRSWPVDPMYKNPRSNSWYEIALIAAALAACALIVRHLWASDEVRTEPPTSKVSVQQTKPEEGGVHGQ